MSFKFRYETLLSYKRHLKEKAEIDLSLAQRRLRQCRERLEELETGLYETHSAFAKKIKQKVPSSVVKSYSAYIAALENGIEAGKIDIADSERVVSEKLGILLEMTKQYKVFEKLKERDFKKWNHRQRLLEQKVMSEVALIRHGKDFLES